MNPRASPVGPSAIAEPRSSGFIGSPAGFGNPHSAKLAVRAFSYREALGTMAFVWVSHIDPKYRLGRGTGGPSQHEMAQRQVPVVCEIAEGGWATTMGHEVNLIINLGHAINFSKIPGGFPPFATDGRLFHGNDCQTRPDPSQYANDLAGPQQTGGKPMPQMTSPITLAKRPLSSEGNRLRYITPNAVPISQ